jgi:hypothetical protein
MSQEPEEPKEITSLTLTPDQKKEADRLQEQIEKGSDWTSKTSQNQLNAYLQQVAAENEAKKKEKIDLDKTVYDPETGTMESQEPHPEQQPTQPPPETPPP